jgi:hypothetical protein
MPTYEKNECLHPTITALDMRVQKVVNEMLPSAPLSAPWPHPPSAFESAKEKWYKVFQSWFLEDIFIFNIYLKVV